MSNLQITIHAKKINVKKVDISNLNSRAGYADAETTEQEQESEESEESEVKQPVVNSRNDKDKDNDNDKKDLKDHTGFSPRFMTIFEEHVDFSKKRWKEVIREIIKSCSITKDDFIEKIAVLQKKELTNYYCFNAVYGKVDGFFIHPERNGWFYIPEFDISIRISTANKMFEIVKTLVKGTKFEGNICLFLHHDYDNKNLYRTVPI